VGAVFVREEGREGGVIEGGCDAGVLGRPMVGCHQHPCPWVSGARGPSGRGGVDVRGLRRPGRRRTVVPWARLGDVLGEVERLGTVKGEPGAGQPRRKKRRGQARGGPSVEGPSPAEAHPLDAYRPGETRVEIQAYPARCLRAANQEVRFDGEGGGEAGGGRLRALAKDMFELMYATDGVGLAAPQVGVNVRLLVYNPEGVPGRGEEFILCNPRIVGRGKRTEWMEEGCLSFPEVYGDVERACEVEVEAQDVDGKPIRLSLEGWQARVFQHEYDHLDGVLFHDRMDARVRAKVQPRLDSLAARYAGEGEPAL